MRRSGLLFVAVLLCAAVWGCSGSAVGRSAAWSTYGATPGRTFSSTHRGPAGGRILWTFEVEGAAGGVTSLVSDGKGRPYVVADGTLHALAADGSTRWTFTSDAGPVRGALAVADDGTVYVGGEDDRSLSGYPPGTLYALGPDGKEKWRVDCESPLLIPPALASDGTVILASNLLDSKSSVLIAVNPKGKRAWSVELRGSVVEGVAMGSDGTIYLSSPGDDPDIASSLLLAFNGDGTKRWEQEVIAHAVTPPVVGPDETVYVGETRVDEAKRSVGSRNGAVSAYDAGGRQKWRLPLGGAVPNPPAIGQNGMLFVSSIGDDGWTLHALTGRGSSRWRLRRPAPLSVPAVDSAGVVFLMTVDRLLALTPDGDKKWETELRGTNIGERLSPVISSEGRLYCARQTGEVYAVGER